MFANDFINRSLRAAAFCKYVWVLLGCISLCSCCAFCFLLPLALHELSWPLYVFFACASMLIFQVPNGCCTSTPHLTRAFRRFLCVFTLGTCTRRPRMR